MLLELNGIKKTYQEFALDVSLALEEGRVVGLIGRNGAGKSTTFKAILDIVRPQEGEIRIFGKDRSQLTCQDREEIGVVLADAGFSEWLTIQDIMAVMEGMYRNFDKKGLEEACERFSLPRKQKIKEFSTGMKAKWKVLLAMSFGAKLLILDEPTAGLDVIARQQVLDLLREYMEQPGRGILISSHISGDLESICDEIYMIDEGKILLHEDTDVLLDSYGVLKLTEEQYRTLDKSAVRRILKESHEIRCLTDDRQFYLENYPELVIEKSSIDDLIMLMIAGKEVQP